MQIKKYLLLTFVLVFIVISWGLSIVEVVAFFTRSTVSQRMLELQVSYKWLHVLY